MQNSEDCKANQVKNPYTSEKLKILLDKVEDWLLLVRKIRIPKEQLNAIHKELLRRNYTPAQMSIATLWIKFGKFPVSKKDIDLSDFYPSKEQIQHLESDFVSKEYHIKTINAIKTDHDIQISKLRHELSNTRLTESDIQQYYNGTLQMINLKDQIKRLEYKLQECSRENSLLKLACEEQKRIIDELENQIKSTKTN